jgi:hypothetical protein
MPVPNPLIAEIHARFHRLWTKAAHTPGDTYDRREWANLQVKIEEACGLLPEVLGPEDPTAPGVKPQPGG